MDTLQPPSAPIYRDQRPAICNICSVVHFNVDSMHAVTRLYAAFGVGVIFERWRNVEMAKCPTLLG